MLVTQVGSASAVQPEWNVMYRARVCDFCLINCHICSAFCYLPNLQGSTQQQKHDAKASDPGIYAVESARLHLVAFLPRFLARHVVAVSADWILPVRSRTDDAMYPSKNSLVWMLLL